MPEIASLNLLGYQAMSHEGWVKRHPNSREYELKSQSHWHTLGTGEEFWDSFSCHLYRQYLITKDTHIIINGDGAPWIRKDINY